MRITHFKYDYFMFSIWASKQLSYSDFKSEFSDVCLASGSVSRDIKVSYFVSDSSPSEDSRDINVTYFALSKSAGSTRSMGSSRKSKHPHIELLL